VNSRKRMDKEPRDLETLMLEIMMLISEIRQNIKEEEMDKVVHELTECMNCYFQPFKKY